MREMRFHTDATGKSQKHWPLMVRNLKTYGEDSNEIIEDRIKYENFEKVIARKWLLTLNLYALQNT